MMPTNAAPAAYLVWIWDTALPGPRFFKMDPGAVRERARDEGETDEAFAEATTTTDPDRALRMKGKEAVAFVGDIQLRTILANAGGPPPWACGWLPVEMARALEATP